MTASHRWSSTTKKVEQKKNKKTKKNVFLLSFYGNMKSLAVIMIVSFRLNHFVFHSIVVRPLQLSVDFSVSVRTFSLSFLCIFFLLWTRRMWKIGWKIYYCWKWQYWIDTRNISRCGSKTRRQSIWSLRRWVKMHFSYEEEKYKYRNDAKNGRVECRKREETLVFFMANNNSRDESVVGLLQIQIMFKCICKWDHRRKTNSE